ncbi:MAG: phosphate ABC transporter ATP-binding protein [Anaerolineae bacterium]
MSEIMYRLEDITKSYDKHQVLSIGALTVQRGEILAIVGPSGAGKSTLLRLLNFVEPPATGTLEFRGKAYRPGDAVPLEERRRVTTVFQRPLLLKQSVQANVAYGLRLRGQRDVRQDVSTALDRVRLQHLARQKATTLSGGEAQRVALARAMALRTDVLLLDEPTANLDPYNVSAIESIVAEINDDRGTTVILVTHNVFQARRLAHRVGLLLDGELIEVSPVDAFFEAPADPRTAAFTRGEMVY